MTIALFSFLAVVVYFKPSIIAMARRHHRKRRIILLNIFSGWTIFGWIGALIWSLTPVKLAHELKRERRKAKMQKMV